MPKPRRVFSIPANVAGLTELMEVLEQSVKKLKLTGKEYIRLQLACEEAFLHMISYEKEERAVIFKIVRDEDNLFVELISGENIEDIDQVVRPPRSLDAGIDEMSKLGLLVLQNTVSDLRHIQISGYAYISFFIPA
jgi:NCS2 family nucleobase:cation symporter-2/xanthine permease XanP